MLNIEEVVRRAISATGCAEPILAASFDLPTRLCRELANRRVIGGYVAEFAIEEGRNDPRVAGWWLDRQAGSWHLIRRGHKSLLFLGPEVDVGGRMLVAARRAGVTSICVLEGGNDCFRRIAVGASLVQRAKTLVVKKAFGSRLLGRGLAAGFEYSGGICYEHAFRDLYEAIGDGLRLQPSEFQEDRALLIVGSLGPGGAERQLR